MSEAIDLKLFCYAIVRSIAYFRFKVQDFLFYCKYGFLKSSMSFIKNLTISQRLFISYLLIGLVTVVIIGSLFYIAFRNAVVEKTLNQLSSINMLKKSRIDDFFFTRRNQLSLMMNDSSMKEAFFYFIEGDHLSETNALSTDKQQRNIKKLLKSFDYDDIRIVSKEGKAVNPLGEKESVLDTLLNSEDKAVKHFFEEAHLKTTRFDASMYGNQSETELAIAFPFKSETGAYLGTVLLHKSFDKVSEILFERTGMGTSGESYIVGRDMRMRSASRFSPSKPPLHITVNTHAVKSAFSGVEGEHILDDYRGVEVLSVWRRLDLNGLDWVIISEIDMEEAMQPVLSIRKYFIYVSVAIIVLIIWFTLMIANNLTHPILVLRGVIEKLAKGILPNDMPDSVYNDEIGEMTKAVNKLSEGIKRTSDFASRIGNNDLDAEYVPLSDEDVLGQSLLTMRDSLKKLKEQEKKLSRQRSAALIEGQENERRRFAREIHDGLGQMLVAIKFRIAALEESGEAKDELKKLLNDTIEEVRRISNNVMPGVLLDFGLEAGLNQLCSNIKRLTNMNLQFNYLVDETSGNLDFDVKVGLYRIAQEALNNSIKYAEAKNAELEVVNGSDFVMMIIKDDGKGFDMKEYADNKAKISNGIKNMKERARLMNGSFYIQSEINKGTVVKVEVPLQVVENEESQLIHE
ncbi:histidine kinase [Cytophagaceae bacterium ABcell3]|nr:histidine kinase [Cytophagaceae bacterium ABcell3]